MTNVSFPGLWGLTLNIDREAFRVFGIPVYWYGIIISFGFLLCILLALRHCAKYELTPDNILDVVIFATPAAIVGARLYYVAFNWDMYKNNIIEIIDTRKGGLAIYGAVIASLIAGYLYAKAKNISVYSLFDFAIVYIPLGQAIGRWGNFFNQEAFGINTDLPWGMISSQTKEYLYRNMNELASKGIIADPLKPVHPTFLYESIWNFAVFLFLLKFRDKKKLPGEVLYMYFILYGLGRFFIEGLRTDSLMIGNIRVSQMLSAVLAVVFSSVMIYRRVKAKSAAIMTEAIEDGGYKHVLSKLNENSQNDAAENIQNSECNNMQSAEEDIIKMYGNEDNTKDDEIGE